MAINSPISQVSPALKTGGAGGFTAAGTGKVTTKKTTGKTKTASTPYDLTKDPLTGLLLGASESAAQRQRGVTQQDITNQLLGIRGQGGTLAQLTQNMNMDQNRIADEMAYRGLLSSGVYAGTTKGVGTQSQNEYGKKITGEKQRAEQLTAPNMLLEQGLRVNAQGAVEPIAPGDPVAWTDPATGETKTVNFDWKLHTAAGREAYNTALSSALASYVGSRTQV
jgi:hypothetical protein